MLEEQGVPVVMRDGATLVADVRRPDTTAHIPVLVSRTPYGRASAASDVEKLVAAGFAVVVQDCRGWFDSEGEWEYARSDIADGFDTVEWAAAQPWSNGRVGMFGASYMANAQWMAAIARPPHLEAVAPECYPSDYWSASFEVGGPFRLALRLSWTASMVATTATTWGLTDPRLAELNDLNIAYCEALRAGNRGKVAARGMRARALLHELYAERPLRSISLWGDHAGWLDEVFEHEEPGDAYWRRIAPSSHYDEVDLPAVHVVGWYDIHQRGNIENFVGMRRQAPTARARAGQHLIVGPWGHWSSDDPIVGDVDFGPRAALDTVQMRTDWFGHWLQEGSPLDWAWVRIFVMGDNEWRDEEEWPLARTRYTSWYLRSDGRLDTAAPAGEAPDGFLYDPRSPMPTLGGRLLAMGDPAGPRDQRPNLGRPDLLAYTSGPLTGETEITGTVLVDLWVATDAPDTDFVAVLTDVHPDGMVYNVCEGAVRGAARGRADAAASRHRLPVHGRPGGHQHRPASRAPDRAARHLEQLPRVGAEPEHRAAAGCRRTRRFAGRPADGVPRCRTSQPGRPAGHPEVIEMSTDRTAIATTRSAATGASAPAREWAP